MDDSTGLRYRRTCDARWFYRLGICLVARLPADCPVLLHRSGRYRLVSRADRRCFGQWRKHTPAYTPDTTGQCAHLVARWETPRLYFWRVERSMPGRWRCVCAFPRGWRGAQPDTGYCVQPGLVPLVSRRPAPALYRLGWSDAADRHVARKRWSHYFPGQRFCDGARLAASLDDT